VNVTAEDQYGNIVTSFVGPVTLTSSDPSAATLGTFNFTAANKGAITISGIVLKTAGTQTLQVSYANGATPIVGTVSLFV